MVLEIIDGFLTVVETIGLSGTILIMLLILFGIYLWTRRGKGETAQEALASITTPVTCLFSEVLGHQVNTMAHDVDKLRDDLKADIGKLRDDLTQLSRDVSRRD